ncbi:class I SAM-dependent methyltransferase [Ornithinibacillus sp. BX22]|uniref:Class I SAM-dependent methyltransferase n=2 Tax=Ornithinibacillus TaxID=484508 RepID=A0A923L949_9BACI|nr:MULTISPECIES: class I SAM-dependent methyltransferase [Ornithinibacillus]MBC5638806.1 class I SAM-dependent methyltransferase [Ornithinibacillus hominis]MBS3679799.1 class I SAM-dependent methyltransferase [Ornithinibacillus massiliensis]
MKADFGKVSKEYAQYRNDLPEELTTSLTMRGIDFQKKFIVDLGSGSGVLTRMLFDQGAEVVGVEPSMKLIEEAKSIDIKLGAKIKYLNKYSEDTGLPNLSYDFVTVLRAWHWFDREASLKEIRRILKPGGYLIIMDSGFTNFDHVVKDTMVILKKLIPAERLKPAGTKADSKQSINSFPVEWFKEWEEYGLNMKDTYNFDYKVSFTTAEWCDRVGTLSWLLHLSKEERNEIKEKIRSHLTDIYGDSTHRISHKFHLVLMRNSSL